MGSDTSGVQDSTTCALSIKVHLFMCKQMAELIDRISNGLLPEIEAAQPRCTSGIQALCQLHAAIERARELDRNCRMSSKLYLAITGETVRSRFEKTKNVLDQSLSQLQSMVPVALENKISVVLYELRATKLFLDSHEEMAGRALRKILQRDESLVDSVGDFELELLLIASSMLQINSHRDLLIEKRCLRKLLEEVKEKNSTKRKTLKYLFYLLKKYDKLIVGTQARNFSAQPDKACISSQLDSETMETSMENLISKWSLEQRDKVIDHCIGASLYGSLESSSNSMRSTASSMKDIDLRIDASSLSLGSLDSSYGTNSHFRAEHSFGAIKESYDAEPIRFQYYPSIEDIRAKFLSNVRKLPWELQVAAVQDVNTYLIEYNPSCSFVSSENFLEPLFLFLQEALDKHDGKSQKAGSRLFLTFLQGSRREQLVMNEHVYTLLVSLLETEAVPETLDIIEALSTQIPLSIFAASKAILPSIFKILDSDKREFQAAVFKILHNFSSKIDSSFNLASEWISLLIPFLEDNSFAGICLAILENLYKFEETRFSVKTPDLIAQIVKLLDKFNCSDQERAVDMLLSLCTQHDYYCELVLGEGGILSLVNVSNNGSNKGKASASELLRQLGETKVSEDVQESPRTNDQKSSKASGFKKWFRKK